MLQTNELCADYVNENEQLKKQLSAENKERLANERIRLESDNLIQKYAALEKHHNQVLADREAILKKVNDSNDTQEASLRVETREKDDIIQELRQEGEKLAKQNLSQSNIIKSLRSKEKEKDQQIKELR